MDNQFMPLYEEMSKLIGEDATKILYTNYKGLQICFPKKLYSADYVKSYVKVNSDRKSIQEMATEFGYSERTIRGFKKL